MHHAGALAQTYEDPAHKDAWTGLLGDGDPVDVCEIGSRLAKTGEAYQVKVRVAGERRSACAATAAGPDAVLRQ